MSQDTQISWCDSTVNAQAGCLGCELWRGNIRHCYAGNIIGKHGGKAGWPKSFDQPVIYPGRIEKACRWSDLNGKDRKNKPWLNGLPRLIFLNDMGDTFTEGLPDDWLRPYIDPMMASSHYWLILTKRPKRMKKFFAELKFVPDNFWLGVSVTDQQTANARIPELVEIKRVAEVRFAKFFVSSEPQLELIDFSAWLGPDFLVDAQFDWLITGGESGPRPRSYNWDWARYALAQCRRAGVPFFVKQGGGHPNRREAMAYIPEDLRIREMPIDPMQDDPTPGAYQPELFG